MPGCRSLLSMRNCCAEDRPHASPNPLTPTPDDAPIRFPGELAVSATLITAPGALPRPAIDLNLMVRRGSYEAEMRRVVVERVGQYRPSADIIALLCRTAGLRISSERD